MCLFCLWVTIKYNILHKYIVSQLFFFVLGSGSRWRWHLHQFLDVKKLVNDADTTTLRKHIIGDFSSCPFLNEKFVVIKFVFVCVLFFGKYCHCCREGCYRPNSDLAVLGHSAQFVGCCFYLMEFDELELFVVVVVMDDDSNRTTQFQLISCTGRWRRSDRTDPRLRRK